MPQLNENEFGQIIYVDMGENVLAATELTLILEPKLGELKERLSGDGVTVGTVNITVDNQTLLANQYLQYTTKVDDLDFAGLWRKKGKSLLSSTNIVISDYTNFTVLD